jgi:hypothetical protein
MTISGKTKYSKKILDLLNSVEAKRPRIVIQHILKKGFITSQELKDLYGYNHPPRAARDVRELGIPLITYYIHGTDGRRIAAYKFGDFTDNSNTLSKSFGRTSLSKALKQALIKKYGAKCFVYLEIMDESLLQVDHRIPYEIVGETNESDLNKFMLLSPSANRAKSWTCQHCENWVIKDLAFCIKCFWANPDDYEHIAGNNQRIISIIFTGNEIEDYNRLIEASGIKGAQNFIKQLIHEHLT